MTRDATPDSAAPSADLVVGALGIPLSRQGMLDSYKRASDILYYNPAPHIRTVERAFLRRIQRDRGCVFADQPACAPGCECRRELREAVEACK